MYKRKKTKSRIKIVKKITAASQRFHDSEMHKRSNCVHARFSFAFRFSAESAAAAYNKIYV